MIELSVKITKATTKDIDSMYEIETLSYEMPWPKEMFVLDYLFDGKAHYYVAKWMRKNIGFLGIWNENDKLHIVNIAVHPDYRKKGVGSKLMQFAIDLAKKLHKKEVYLEVRESNMIAQKMYKKFGFYISGRIEKYYTNGEDGLIMRKAINENTGY